MICSVRIFFNIKFFIMSRRHRIHLTIDNQTKDVTIKEVRKVWFDSGGLSKGSSFPEEIPPGQIRVIDMDEQGSIVEGCSGFVEYLIVAPGHFTQIAFAYSNPISGTNKLGAGYHGQDVWDNMSNHDYKPFNVKVDIDAGGDVSVDMHMQCSGGATNVASVVIYPITK